MSFTYRMMIGSLVVTSLACGAGADPDGQSAGGGSAATTSDGAGGNGNGAGGPSGGNGGGTSTSTGSAMPECVGDESCPAGQICDQGQCVPGCTPTHGCDVGSCCEGQCFDLGSDIDHCGSCDNPCAIPPNIEVTCDNVCQYGACEAGYNDCDGDSSNGCEVFGDCACSPGSVQPCYYGPPNTENVGPCVAGSQVCNGTGTGWGFCQGVVLPDTELCANNIDDDCNGFVDDVPDLDGDGWTTCQGDCCDESGASCSNPELVNPGAFEYPGNSVDDDCDGTVDNPVVSCDGALASNSASGLDYAKAIDLCQTTTANPPLNAKKWGVIAATFSKADGTGSPATDSRSIRTGFGSGVTPHAGSSLAVLSTGAAAAQSAPNNTNPPYTNFQGGRDMAQTSGVPADWLSANGNNFPNAPGCPDPQNGTTAHDPIMLTLTVRVPTNAGSFSLDSFFYSSEYPEWVCSPYNDFFLALLDSSFIPGPNQSPNPADKNLAFFDPPPAGGAVYPVGVNLAFGNTGLFTQCLNGATGCGSGSVSGTTNTCTGTTQLTGTGFQIANPPPQFAGDPGYCGASNLAGGGTSWLSTTGNVTPGETMTLRLAIWDTGDQWYDSVVLLDNFLWAINPSTPGTQGD